MSKISVKKPSFFIIGAPKCGTTALRSYLMEHPSIFMPGWELHFFSADISTVVKHKDLDNYLRIFSPAPSDSLIGEKSVWYLYSREAVKNILAFNPEARFIVMLRNPLEMAYSLHSQNSSGSASKEDIRDFEAAWYAQEDRKNGMRIPNGCLEPAKLQYGAVCKLGEQLERLYSSVPRERVKIILFDDFKADTKQVYQEILEFLGVSYDGRTKFPVIRQNKVVIYPRLLQLLYTIRRLKRRFRIPSFNLHVLRFFMEKTRPEKMRKPLPDTFKQELTAYFEEDIRKLSQLTGWDLSHWIM